MRAQIESEIRALRDQKNQLYGDIDTKILNAFPGDANVDTRGELNDRLAASMAILNGVDDPHQQLETLKARRTQDLEFLKPKIKTATENLQREINGLHNDIRNIQDQIGQLADDPDVQAALQTQAQALNKETQALNTQIEVANGKRNANGIKIAAGITDVYLQWHSARVDTINKKLYLQSATDLDTKKTAVTNDLNWNFTPEDRAADDDLENFYQTTKNSLDQLDKELTRLPSYHLLKALKDKQAEQKAFLEKLAAKYYGDPDKQEKIEAIQTAVEALHAARLAYAETKLAEQLQHDPKYEYAMKMLRKDFIHISGESQEPFGEGLPPPR